MREGRLPAPTGDLRTDAIRELRWAMGGAGLTIDKLAVMAEARRLPRVHATLVAMPEGAGLTAALAAIVAEARNLGDGLYARVLRNALAVDYTGDAKDLTARRTDFVRAHNDVARAERSRNVIAESPRAMYDIEQEMLGALVTALGAPPPRAAATFRPEPLPPGDVPRARPAMSTACAYYDVTYRLRGRAGVESEVVYVLRALEDGVDMLTVSYWCEADDGPPAEFALREGGTLIDDASIGRPGFRCAHVRYPKSLRTGETHRVRFDIRYSGAADPDPWFTIDIAKPTDRAVVRVSFDRDEPPSRVWRVDGVLAAAAGGDPDSAKPLVPDSTGVVETVFDNPRLASSYGVAWQW